MKSFSTIEELETFILKHGENIVDLMGGEIDRIEIKLRVCSIEHYAKHQQQNLFTNCFPSILQKKFPEIRHCDLEIL